MENCGHGKEGSASATLNGIRCPFCDDIICFQCIRELAINGANVPTCSPRPEPQTAVAPPRTDDEERPRSDGTASSEPSFRTMLMREGNRMLERVTRNVASATDHLFGNREEEEDEDIDRLVEEFKKSQLEEQGKNKKC